MIDINRIRNNKEEVEKALLKRMDKGIFKNKSYNLTK